jgi:hypothetical protein
MSINEIVDVSITRETQAVSQTGFGILNILGKNLNSGNRIEYFSTDALSALSAVLCGGTSSEEYLAAVSAASQVPKPSQIAVSQRIAPKILTDDAGTYTAGSFKFTVNGGTEKTVAYNTDKNTTLTAVATALQALDEVATATYVSGTHTITVTPASGYVLGIETDISGITGTMAAITITSGTASEDHTDALDAIVLEDNDWYGLIITDRTAANVAEVAFWAEANTKLFATASADPNIINQTLSADTTSIAADFKSKTYDRSFALYHPNAATTYPDAGFLGGLLARVPGSYTGMFKQIRGSSVVALTATQSKNALDKSCNVYQLIGGANMTRNATVGSGEYIDVIHFIDWFDARMTEGVFGLLARSAKVPFTPEGLVAVQGEIDSVGKAGIDAGGLSKTRYDDDGVQVGGFYSTMPDFDSISVNDKAARLLQSIRFVAYLAGAIHKVVINGTITY